MGDLTEKTIVLFRDLQLFLEDPSLSAKIEQPSGDAGEAVVEAARGLTCAEAENAFALSVA